MNIDGLTISNPEVEYDWEVLGGILADGLDREQAVFLTSFSASLFHEGGPMQVEYLADWLKQWPEDEVGDIDDVKWVLRELLERLEGD